MADFDYIVPTGVILPDTAELQAQVEAEYREAFGEDVVLTPDTPQGVLVTGEVLARDGVVRNNAALANQINPDQAGGVFLDALWALTGGGRLDATRSVVYGAILNGAPGTIIQAGAQVRVGETGPIFETVGAVQIAPGGTVAADFRSLEYGPVAAPVGELNRIVTAVLGWEGVTNPAGAVPGRTEESDAAARRRRRDTLALQGTALGVAIVSGLYDVDGVRSVAFRENVADTTETIDGVELVPHSIYAAVDGGTDLDVATMLLARRSNGANWNGNTAVNVLEAISGQTYAVAFQRPDPVNIYAKVTVSQGTETQDPVPAIKAAIVAYAAGETDGETGFVIGGAVSPWELAGAVARALPGLYISKVEIGLDPGTVATDNIPVTLEQIARISEAAVNVVVL